MGRTLQDQLANWNKKHEKWNKTKQIRTNIKEKRNSEQFSESDIKELMGVNRPTYKRHKGSFRQK